MPSRLAPCALCRIAQLGRLEKEVPVVRETLNHEVDKGSHAQRLLGSMTVVDVDGLALGHMLSQQWHKASAADVRYRRKDARA